MKRSIARAVGRWLGGSLAVILTIAAMTGCQQTYVAKDVWEQSQSAAMLPPLEQNQGPPTAPILPTTKAPPSVIFPERKPREMTLDEAIAISLETGLVSNNAPEGQAINTLGTFSLGTTSMNLQSDSIRVIRINPALAQATMEASLARFDAIWVTSASMNGVDGIPGVVNIGNVNSPFAPGQAASFQSSIVKAFANGAVANVSFLTDYRKLQPTATAFTGLLNPEYIPRVAVGLEIPLWRDAGVEINQLLPRFPTITGSQFTGSSAFQGWNYQQGKQQIFGIAGQPLEGTLVTRLRFDQTRAEFERNVQTMVKNVEIAYWNLYNKYGQLYSFEENLRILQRAYQENDIKLKAGNLDPYKFYQTKGQFEEFRANRTQALEEVLDAERNLRGLLGMAVEDGERIVPITPPNLAEIRPNWESSLQDALNLRPELVLARDNVRYHQYLLSIQKNNLKPDLRAFMNYQPFGEGSSLLGGGTFTDLTGVTHSAGALQSLAGGHLNDYTLGVFMNVPLGYRFELAAIRSARLQLAQSYYFLLDQENRATRYLANQYQDVQHWYKRIETHRSERLAYVDSLRKLEAKIKAGVKDMTYGNLEFLSVQRSYAAALVKEYAAIAEYNNALARLEWAKGTTLQYNNIHISEGALPQCAQERAVEYERERSRSLVLNGIRPDSLSQPGRLCATKEEDVYTQNELPPVTVTDNPDNPWSPPLPAPAVAEQAKKVTVPTPSTPLPAAEKVEFRPASKSGQPVVPPPAKLPSMDTRPIEQPSSPLFLQSTSSLSNPVVPAFTPIVARGVVGEPVPR